MSRRRGPARRLVALVLLLVAFPTMAPARAESGEVGPNEDNPPGCTTATGEDNDGCGAQGRDHFANAGHKPPIEACADATAPSGSRITRVVPDGPRRGDGSLAFVSGACVYLPPGYASSGLQYPVLYVLHGGGGDQADWVTFGQIQAILDRAYAADPSRAVIAVMPDGRSGQWYDYEDRSFLIETYVIDHLVPYVDRHFRTITDRTGRGVVGLSNGGYGAIHLAGKRPDLFVTAGGMSSNLGARTLSGLGEDGAVHYQGSVPYQLAENYDGVDIVLDVANYCTAADPLCATIALDLLFTPDHLAFVQRMNDIGHKGALDMRQADGAHQFRWWSQWLEERQLPFLQQRLVDPRPTSTAGPGSRIPTEFRYRTIKPRFSVWGYDVTVERDVREFLDLRAVTAGGFEVQGSGRATILTARYYEPLATYTVTGSGPGTESEAVTADGTGRLRIAVDLGPSHTVDQFTTDADVAAATGPYWTVRKVIIAGPDGAPVTDAPPPLVPVAGSSGSGAPFGDTAAYGIAAGDLPAAGTAAATAASDAVRRATPAAAVAEQEPQLVPTIAFLLALAGSAAFWWRRRRSALAEEAG